MSTHGPAFDEKLDGDRVATQLETIRAAMLFFSRDVEWITLAELEGDLDYPQASISRELRRLRESRFGGYTIEKRWRAGAGTWEYHIRKPLPSGQGELWEE